MNSIEKSLLGSSTLSVMQEQEERKLRLAKKRSELAKVNLEGKRGRSKGSKNKLTLLRQAVMEKAEHMVLSDWEEVVRMTLDMAKQGDSVALKILWDRVIPSKKAIDPTGETKDKMNITINISGLEVKSVMDEAVDADFEEVEIEDNE